MIVTKFNKKVDILFFIIVIVNLAYLLFPTLDKGFVTISINENELFVEFYQLKLAIFNAICFLLVILIDKDLKLSPLLKIIFLLNYFYFISLLANGFKNVEYAVITTPLSYIAIFGVLFRYNINKNISSFLFIILLLWCIIPVYLLLVLSNVESMKMFNVHIGGIISTFRGFALHRNIYGFYAGIAIILLFFVDLKNKWRVFLFFILFAGILLSESRTALIASIFVPFYFYIKSKKISLGLSLSLIFSGILVLILLDWYLYLFSVRGDSLFFSSTRYELIMQYLNVFKNNLFFGGLDENFENVLGPSHNFIIDVLANYGIFTGLFFFIFVYHVWKQGSLFFKILWLYLLLFGLTQPYFRFGPIANLTLILSLTAIAFNKKEGERISPIPFLKVK
ncbi:MAG: O-antigen polymerase [Melioribacteraceae bacterium]